MGCRFALLLNKSIILQDVGSYDLKAQFLNLNENLYIYSIYILTNFVEKRMLS